MSALPWLWIRTAPGGRWHMVGDQRRVELPGWVDGRRVTQYRYEARGDCARSSEWVTKANRDDLATGVAGVELLASDVPPDELCSFCVAALRRRIEHLQETLEGLLAEPPENS